MSTYTNPAVQTWLEISKMLLQQLLGDQHDKSVFGIGMPPSQFAKLVDSEALRVDHALVAMSVSRNEEELTSIFSQLSRETIIAMMSRWAHYTSPWNQMLGDSHPQLWVPPKAHDVWRAVLLAMTSESIHSSDAARTLWPDTFSVSNDE
jgi:hypothetical protein